jgi:hypothetical protein
MCAERQYGAHPQEREPARFRVELEQNQLRWNELDVHDQALYVVTELDGGIFLQGDLISPRGGTTDSGVFVLFAEWDCGK